MTPSPFVPATILVTGGAGFIGSNFVRWALSGDPRVRIVNLDVLTYAGNLESLADVDQRYGGPGEGRYTFVHGDIRDFDGVRRLLRGANAVVHFAAESHVDRSILGPEIFVDTNVKGTLTLLEACRAELAEHPRPFRLVHVSTDEVYGTLGPEGAFSETTPYAPNSPYAASKAAADHLVRAWHETYGLPVLITNCSNNYGPFQYPEKLIPLMVLNAVEGKPLPIYGDGGNVRDWLYVEDHCEGVLLALRRGQVGEKYNIGGGGERTNLQVVDALCAALEAERPAGDNAALARRGIRSYAELKTLVPDRPGHDRRYAIDARKIRAELGWSPRHGFEEGLQRTVRWYLANRAWCEAVQSGKYGRERLGLP